MTKEETKLVPSSHLLVRRPAFLPDTVHLRTVAILLHIRIDLRKVRGVVVVVQLLAVIITIITTNSSSNNSTNNNFSQDTLPVDLHILISGRVLVLSKI
jgi:hypothetical protein